MVLILNIIGDEEFLILACDGLWDTVEPFDAVQLVRECVKEGCRDTSANKLVNLAIEQRSMDNISILVIFFDFNKGTNTCTTTATSSSSSTNNSGTTNHIVVSEKDENVGLNDQKLKNKNTAENTTAEQDKEAKTDLDGETLEKTVVGST